MGCYLFLSFYVKAHSLFHCDSRWMLSQCWCACWALAKPGLVVYAINVKRQSQAGLGELEASQGYKMRASSPLLTGWVWRVGLEDLRAWTSSPSS